MEEELKVAVLSVLRAIRNGMFYGTKIRLPHALVMTLLFRRSSNLRKMADPIARMTWEHSKNLAAFAGGYKMVLALARLLRVQLGEKLTTPPGIPVTQLDSFLAASLIGLIVWGRYSSVNSQIVMYLMSRIILALFKVAAEKKILPGNLNDLSFDQVYPFLAAGVWGIVLWLYEYHPEKLLPSLFTSMDFLYHETNQWNGGLEDFLPSPATAGVFVYLTLRARELAMGK
mmetsp:Transcript_19579/g.36173  ORF Transcript_19579/g.36173 Transcript_19579/m.36173 type:complete len:229 (-) Transcript_19579:47-733(-)